ncbi:MAG: helix-hairpin-helix domain-containing protein, partial [Enhydrobacter sp.]
GAAKPAAPAAATKMVNLNTATAAELDALPQIGAARSKAIIDARAKAKFKNWDDFVARKVVPSNAEAAIKSQVSF